MGPVIAEPTERENRLTIQLMSYHVRHHTGAYDRCDACAHIWHWEGVKSGDS